jgi:phosphatidylethanolamine-binding protein
MSLNTAEIHMDIECLEEDSPSDKTSFKATWGDVSSNSGILDVSVPQSPPKLSFVGKTGKKYTCIKTDPDAISRTNPIFREFIHWVISDLEFGEDGSQTTEGNTILSYCGPGPPHASGLHRYVFLLYEQSEGSNPESLAGAFEGRGGKKAHVSAKVAGLGSCVAMSYFESEWGPCVDAVHESLGFVPPDEYKSPKQREASA